MKTHIRRRNNKLKAIKPKLKKNTEKENILKVFEIECCKNKCTHNFSFKEIEEERTFFHRKSEKEKDEYLEELLKVQEVEEKTEKSCKIKSKF